MFTLRLPLPDAEPLNAPPWLQASISPTPTPTPQPTATAAPDALPQRHGAHLSVLLAEDNEVNVYIVKAMLEDQALDLDVAINGPTALELLRQRIYDLAFIDIQMPGMDGLSMVRGLRRVEALSARPRTPVVALTANAFATDVQASLAAGCDRHLAKPVSQGALLAALSELARRPADAPGAAAAGAGSSTLDAAAAIARLGGDAALYRSMCEHARVFMESWERAFSNRPTTRATARRPAGWCTTWPALPTCWARSHWPRPPRWWRPAFVRRQRAPSCPPNRWPPCALRCGRCWWSCRCARGSTNESANESSNELTNQPA